MAQSQVRSAPAAMPLPTKMSYSKIAAMPAPAASSSQHIPGKGVRQNHINGTREPSIQNTTTITPETSSIPSVRMPAEGLQLPLSKLSLVAPASDVIFSEHNGDSGDSYEEERSQVSTSSLNKPHSFDTKSLASVTTFAMDDKESIRPDDSASVRAVDDDHPQSALSRNSSFQHDVEQLSHRLPPRVLTSNVTIPGRRFPTLVNPPKFGNFGSLPISPVLESQDLILQPPAPLLSADEPRDTATIVGLPPDEKLIEALASVKDRLSLLQLEEKILFFIASTNLDVLELPPQNGFTRLLTHRLADYYGLAHQNTEDHSSVRVSRSGAYTLPTPLSQLAKAIPIGSAIGPSSAAVKIMRREQLGSRQFSAGTSTAPSSSVPSKATSENGNEGPSDDGLTSPTESTPSRDKSKLTREEREAQYKAVRERIFGDTQENISGESMQNVDPLADLSRSSSSSGKKKHRKHKQPKDDSFEARSAYVQSFTPLQGNFNNAYVDPTLANGYPVSPISYDASMYGTTPTQNFPGFEGGMGYANMQPYSPTMMQQYSPGDWQQLQAQQNGFFMYPNGMSYHQGQNGMMSPNQMMHPQVPDWYATQYGHGLTNGPSINPGLHFPQHSIDPRGSMSNDQFGRSFHRPHSTASVHQPNAGPKNNKSLFNPQTRSFVPNNVEGRSGGRNTRQQKQARNSLGGYGQAANANLSTSSQKSEDSLKSRYGTPPSLPKKPPPSEVKHSVESISPPAPSNGSLTDETMVHDAKQDKHLLFVEGAGASA